MRQISQWIFLVIVLFSSKFAMSEPIDITDLSLEKGASLYPLMREFKDPHKKIVIEDILSKQDSFVFSRASKGMSYGFYSGAIWFQFEVKSNKEQHVMLEVQPSFLDDIRLYQQSEMRKLVSLQTGDHISANDRVVNSRNMIIPLTIQPGINKFWLRIESTSSIFVIAKLWHPEALVIQLQHMNLLYGILFGVLLLGCFVSIFCWLWFKQAIFLIAALFILSIAMLQFTLKGFDQIYLYPSSGIWPDRIVGVATCTIGAVIQLFIIYYLDVSKYYPRLAKFIIANQILWWLGAVASVLGFYPIFVAPMQNLGALVLFGLLVLCLWMLRHEKQHALLALLTFVPNQVLLLLMLGVNIGVLPSGDWTLHAYAVSAIFQVCFTVLVVLFNLRDAERLAVINMKQHQAQRRFYSMMAHELRTPLSVITSAITNLQLLERDNGTSHAARFSRINGALARLNFILDNALAENRLSQIENASRQDVIVLKEFLLDLQQLFPTSTRHPVNYICPDTPCVFIANRHWLMLAVLNLLDNAVKYSPQGGVVNLHVSVQTNRLCFSVTDQGIGVPEHERQWLFDKHFRGALVVSNSDLIGVGLGLYLVSLVAKHHGGEAGYQPEESGSNFYISIAFNDIAM